MALTGLRPVVEMRVVDFALCAIDEIVNQAAKNRYMFGGQGPRAAGRAPADRHLERLGGAAFAIAGGLVRHIPGLVVVTLRRRRQLRPARGGDSLRRSGHLHGTQGIVGPGRRGAATAHGRPGQAARRRDGPTDAGDLVGHVHTALAAAGQAAQQGVSVEVIDLRTIWPWDRELVFASAARTGRLLVAHEAVQAAGFGAEVAATVAEEPRHPGQARRGSAHSGRYARTLEDVARISAQNCCGS